MDLYGPPAVSDKFISNDIKVLEIDKKIQIAVVLRIQGNFTFIIVGHPVAPSTRAASISSFGTLVKPAI